MSYRKSVGTVISAVEAFLLIGDSGCCFSVDESEHLQGVYIKSLSVNIPSMGGTNQESGPRYCERPYGKRV